MRNLNPVTCLTFVILLLTGALANAAVVGFSSSGLGYAESIGSTYSSLEVSPYFTPSSTSGPFFRPFGTLTFSAAGVGSNFVADNTTPDFLAAVSLLTNGTADEIGQDTITLGGSSGSSESVGLWGPGFTDPDFQGSTINSMILTLDSYSSVYDPAFEWDIDQFGPAYVTTFVFTITYENNVVPVPVPSALALLGTGLFGAFGLRRRLHSA